EEIGQAVFRVAEDINTGRPRPGAVEIPIDFQYAKAEIDIPHVEAWSRKAPDRDAVAKAADAIKGASKVVIWAGGGVLTAGAKRSPVQTWWWPWARASRPARPATGRYRLAASSSTSTPTPGSSGATTRPTCLSSATPASACRRS